MSNEDNPEVHVDIRFSEAYGDEFILKNIVLGHAPIIMIEPKVDPDIDPDRVTLCVDAVGFDPEEFSDILEILVETVRNNPDKIRYFNDQLNEKEDGDGTDQ